MQISGNIALVLPLLVSGDLAVFFLIAGLYWFWYEKVRFAEVV